MYIIENAFSRFLRPNMNVAMITDNLQGYQENQIYLQFGCFSAIVAICCDYWECTFASGYQGFAMDVCNAFR